MGISGNFINNWNIMFLVFYGYIVATGFFVSIFKIFLPINLQKISLHFFKQGLITLLCLTAIT